MNKIRVLHVIRTLNIGGAQTFIMNLYKNIDREKIQFDFLLNEKGVLDEEISALGGRIYYIPYLTEVGPKKYCEYLTNFFNQHKEYKIVHSHMNQVSGIILKMAKKCNIPIRISHCHNTGNKNHIIHKIYKVYLQSKITKNATHLMACSKEAAKWLFRNKASNTIILNNGIEIEKFKFSEEIRGRIRKEFKINKDDIVIGNVARFSPQKNLLFLIEIFSEYYKKDKNAKLFLIGEGPLEEKCKQRARELKVNDNVIFAGLRENINELINAFDIFVLPSLYEGLGIVLIEAQANGLQCIASDKVPMVTNITGNVNFVPLKCTAEIWANKIEEKCHIKRTETYQMIKDNRYDIKDVANQLSQIYIESIEKIGD